MLALNGYACNEDFYSKRVNEARLRSGLKETEDVEQVWLRRNLERAKGIEPSYRAWEALVLPLNYARFEVRKAL